MKILALSDKVIPFIYSPLARQRFADVDLVIGCGDLPYYYLEYVLTVLNYLYYVRGNHDHTQEYSPEGHQRLTRIAARLASLCDQSQRACWLAHRAACAIAWVNFSTLNLRCGCMYCRSFRLCNRNRLVHGRYLDIFVTHAATGWHSRSIGSAAPGDQGFSVVDQGFSACLPPAWTYPHFPA
jgi:hypothetical protein